MERSWYYMQAGQQVGPLTEQNLQNLFRNGRLPANVMVWTEELTEWVEASWVEGVVPPIVPTLERRNIIVKRSKLQETTITAAKHNGYAGFWKRFAAFLVDWIIRLITGTVLGLIVSLPGMLAQQTPGADIAIGIVSAILNFFIGIIVGWLYPTVFESSSYQATPGKMLLGIKVTDLNGNRISFAKANGRFFGTIISTFIFNIGYIMAGFTEKKQALHDMMSGCLVVNKN